MTSPLPHDPRCFACNPEGAEDPFRMCAWHAERWRTGTPNGWCLDTADHHPPDYRHDFTRCHCGAVTYASRGV